MNFKNLNFQSCRDCDRGLCACAVGRQDKQLNTYDWLADVPGNAQSTDLVEVQFKNTRKGYYHNVNNLDLKKGDIVAVEANPGHDIGVVTLTGRLVKLQLKKANLKSADDIKRIYRIAKPVDMDKYKESKSREYDTMIQSRQIAKSLGLAMKIGDVEYQGDGNKAIFYYIADGRVDFRQLIKVLAETFHVRIEMKQIGARQEAGRIGGTGPCGRELCCATWMKNFSSVSTNAARYQDISLNPQKLAGMCAKLKCCLNYEVDDYVEASKELPKKDIILQTKDNDYYLFKTDILARLCTYSTDKNLATNLENIPAKRALEIIQMNKNGKKPLSLQADGKEKAPEKPVDLLANTDVCRFDKNGKKKKKKNQKDRNVNAASRTQNPANQAAHSKENPNQPERQPRKATDNKPEGKAAPKHQQRNNHTGNPSNIHSDKNRTSSIKNTPSSDTQVQSGQHDNQPEKVDTPKPIKADSKAVTKADPSVEKTTESTADHSAEHPND
nr:regulatory iron-sulfur-containing complex subunit RicT [uncultured Prevotella sp.]